MKRLILLLAAILFAQPAYAVPSQVQPGTLSTTSCPGGITPCFVPYSNSNPLPTTATFSGSVTTSPTKAAGAYSAITVGTSSGLALAASTATVFLDLYNVSNTATVCCNLGATATISGTQCAAGEIALPPLWHRSWEGNFIPTDAINCIASAASTQLTVGAN